MNFDLGVIVSTVIGIVFSAFGYLLSRKDDYQSKLIDDLSLKHDKDVSLLADKDIAQIKLIDDLYTKHDTDANRLTEVELRIALDYPTKPEIKLILDDMKSFLSDRFNRIEKRLDQYERRGHDE